LLLFGFAIQGLVFMHLGCLGTSVWLKKINTKLKR